VTRFKERVVLLSEQVRTGLIKAANEYEVLLKKVDEYEKKLARIRENASQLGDEAKMFIWASNETLAEDLGISK